MDNLSDYVASHSIMDLHYVNKPPQQNTGSSGLRHLDPETDFKVRRIVANVNETAHIAANEPTMGLYRIQEHVHRTLPTLVQRKTELKKNLALIEGATYDLNLSTDVIDSVSQIKHFTRIQAALTTALETKRKLNIQDEQERARLDLNLRNAALANRSISQNEPAEGYICPICYFALSSQDNLIIHWQEEHSLNKYENDVFQDVSMPTEDGNFVVKQDNDLTVIDIVERSISTAEDVVKSFIDDEPVNGDNMHEQNEVSASEASDELLTEQGFSE